jgi:undecaprenyl-diphosphatase
MNGFIEFDHELFHRINHDWSNSIFDAIFPNITDLHRNPYFVGLLVVLLGFWIWQKRIEAIRWILVLAFSLALSDGISYRIIKHTTERLRPSEAGLQVDLRTNLHSGSSFPSNHAANVFAGATVLSLAFPVWSGLFFIIAAAVAYSRVYVGVHFPLDVFAGALLGSALGWAAVKSAARWFKLKVPERS